MKHNLYFVFIISTSLFFSQNLFSQQYYVEQNSGVSVNLTSVGFWNNVQSPSQTWVCGNNGTVLKTTNQGTNWINVGINGVPSTINLINIYCGAFDTALTAGNIGSTSYVYRTANGGLNWTQVFSQTNGSINAIWMKSGLQGFMCGNPVGGRWSLWKTSNGGVNWDSSGLYIPQAVSETGWNNSLEIINNNIWFGTNNSRIYRSTNYGINWTAFSTAPEVNSTAIWHFKVDTTFTFMGGNNLYNSTNGGTTWTQIPCSGTGTFKGFCVGPIFVNNSPWYGPTFTVRGADSIYISWTGQFRSEYKAPSGVYNHIAYSNMSYYGSAPFSSWAVRSNGGITYFFTGRGGAVRTISSEIPNSFSLFQNFPNPFNPTTKIRFSIPVGVAHMQPVQMKVYDILGREIQTLVNEQLKPGTYEVDFDGTNFTSGVYYYKLSASTSLSTTYTETKKLVLIK